VSWEALSSRPGAALALALGLTALLAIPAARVQHRYEIEDFFPRDTPARADYDRLVDRFGRDDRTAFLLIEDPQGLDADSLGVIHGLTERLQERPELERVVSPTHTPIVVRRAADDVRLEQAIPSLPPDPERVEQVLRTYRTPPYVDALVSRDGKLAAVGCLLAPDRLGFPDRKALRDGLEAEVPGLEAAGLTVHLGGYPIQRVQLAELAGGESGTFLPAALGGILLVLLLALRRAVAVVLPLCVAVGAAVWATGGMGLLGLPPNIFGPAVYVLIVVTGVTDSVHLLARLVDLERAGHLRPQAATLALAEAGPPCGWATLTTALAFGSLQLTGLPMIEDLGLQVALGVGAAYVLTLLLFPAAVRWLPAGVPPQQEGGLVRRVLRVDAWAAARPGVVVAGFAVAFALSGLFASRVQVNSPLLSDLDPDHPARVTNALLAERLGGAIPLEILIEAPSGGFVNTAAYAPERLERVEAFTDRLRRDPRVLSATSAVDLLRRLVDLLPQVPPDEAPGLLPTALLLVEDQLEPWLAEDEDLLRVRTRIADLDTRDALALFEDVEGYAAETLQEPVLLTGQGYLAQLANRDMVDHFQASFVVAVIGIAVVLLLVAGDPRLALATLLPNVFPVVLTAGAMGLCGVDLRYTSALVLAVVFGVATDDTIHFVAQLRRQRAAGVGYALRDTCRTAGPGLVLTSLVLGAGFSVLGLSTFLPLRVMGGLLLLTAGAALSADLLLLPALLRVGRQPPGRDS
jgi:predicted RND superfamily exporter protein